MSVSINIIAKREVSVYDADITYNLAKMYYKALDKNLGLKRLNDLRCKEALPIIDNAIKDMICNKEYYEKFNPTNGWGSYDELLKAFRKMREVCEDNPDGIFKID